MLLSFLLHLAPLAAASVRHRRQQVNQNPTVGGDPDDGWQEFPHVSDATAYPGWVVNQDVGAKVVRLTLFLTIVSESNMEVLATLSNEQTEQF